jgi:hypothetical protein
MIKVQLQDQGNHVETPWAEDLGPVGDDGARRVRLANIPFLHAKPTYEDMILVTPNPDGFLTWDAEGVAWEQIPNRIEEDAGRWVMIVDYAPTANADAQAVFSALDVAAEEIDVCVEGCSGPRDGKPGRAYLAVPAGMTAETVMAHLAEQQRSVDLTLVHPRDDE